MKRMLINATQPEELRVALVDGQRLYDFDIEIPSKEQKKSNIYKGTITRIEPSLEAAFVNYGAERHGFLPFKEISPVFFGQPATEEFSRREIKEFLKEGQEVVVQIEKEERGSKGAALTTYISLAGSYLVLMPNNPRAGGISRRIEGDTRSDMRETMNALQIPDGMGLIIRTAGGGKTVEELQWDLNYLLQLWEAIERSAKEKAAPFLIFQESNVIIRALRDHLRGDIDEILIDSPSTHKLVTSFLEQVMPQFIQKAKLYSDSVPLFSRYQIESQIETAYSREVPLPSGGAIVIDPAEALTSIDINSARATKGGDIEETALNTNLEAAEEIARQLRLRDLGGLFVIDFIDMMAARNQRAVETRLRDALKSDRARIQLGRISRFGLLEMSRQRLRPSLGEATLLTCPRCKGQGSIRNVESLALSVMRIIEEEAMKKNTQKVIAHLPVEAATYLLNEKRSVIQQIEARQSISIVIIPSKHLETPDFDIQRIRVTATEDELPKGASYQLAYSRDPEVASHAKDHPVRSEQPAVKEFLPPSPAPNTPPPAAPQSAQGGGLIKRFLNIFSGSKAVQDSQMEEVPAVSSPHENRRSQDRSTPRRHERYGSGGHERRQRPERGERSERQDRDRGERGDRLERRERPAPTEREAMSVLAPAVAEVEPALETGEQNTNLSEGNRDPNRRSSRRRRGRRGESGGFNRNHQHERTSHREIEGPVAGDAVHATQPKSVAMPAESEGVARADSAPPTAVESVLSEAPAAAWIEPPVAVPFEPAEAEAPSTPMPEVAEQAEFFDNAPNAETDDEGGGFRRRHPKPQRYRPRTATEYIGWNERSASEGDSAPEATVQTEIIPTEGTADVMSETVERADEDVSVSVTPDEATSESSASDTGDERPYHNGGRRGQSKRRGGRGRRDRRFGPKPLEDRSNQFEQSGASGESSSAPPAPSDFAPSSGDGE